MVTASPFQLALWQSVSRHLDIAESTESTAELLASHVPIHSLVTRRLEPEHRRVRIAAQWPQDLVIQSAGEIQLPESAWNRLERWVRQKAVTHLAAEGSKAESLLELLQLPDNGCDWLEAPLIGEHGSHGVLAACASAKHRFSAADIQYFEASLEPMGIAL